MSIKHHLKKILYSKRFARVTVLSALRLHNFSYKVVSIFAPHIEADGLHPKHRIMKYHDFFLDNLSGTDEVLDVGCGNGALSVDIARKTNKVVGIDIVPENIAKAREFAEKSGLNNIEVIVGDATSYKTESKFDVIVLSNVLEHIEKRTEFLKKLTGLSRKFLIRVPLVEREWLAPYKRELGVEYRLDPTHFIEYTLEGFREEIEGAELKIASFEVRYGEIWSVCFTTQVSENRLDQKRNGICQRK